MPETVEKLRRSFDAAGWTPEKDLPIDEKQHRTREESYDDDHQRDAMAAALSAYDDHEDQFDRIAQKVPPRVDTGEVTARVVAGEESVETVLADLGEDDGDGDSGGEAEENDDHQPANSPRKSRRSRSYGNRSSASRTTPVRWRTPSLRRTSNSQRRKKSSQARSDERIEVRRDREGDETPPEDRAPGVRTRGGTGAQRGPGGQARPAQGAVEARPLELRRRLREEAGAHVGEGRRPVHHRRHPREADESIGLIEDDIVLLRDASGAGRSTAQELADVDPKLVLRTGGLSDVADTILFEHGIPVAPAEMVTVQEVDELAVAREEEVEAAIADWEDRAEERRRDRNAEMVDRLISEHRAGERGRATERSA